MEVVVRVTVGPSTYTHHVKKELVLELPDTESENPADLKRALRIAENNLKDMVRSIDVVKASSAIKDARIRKEIKKELEAAEDSKTKASYEYVNEIDELKKEIKKRDCRMDGIIASRNPDYVPPNEDGEPMELK